ncbi:MAG: Rdx family protein [Pirellulales bacterium]|nr:Rdx family protein [Pirellulales bacterium]
MTTKLLEAYKQQISGLTLIPSGGGAFELKLDGELVYSKLDTGEFPQEDHMVDLVGQRLSANS